MTSTHALDDTAITDAISELAGAEGQALRTGALPDRRYAAGMRAMPRLLTGWDDERIQHDRFSRL